MKGSRLQDLALRLSTPSHYPKKIPMGHNSATKLLREKVPCVLQRHGFKARYEDTFGLESCSRKVTDLDPKVQHAKGSYEDMLTATRHLKERKRESRAKVSSGGIGTSRGKGALKRES